ncbi:MAG TPA: ABC transporter ATP-binding protein [Steroidobacter sp.]|uniref:ABC transporter ATP-binding protein n=1 Tax=Steroidobacter sp. TaxID=1978227 RepID=UPI002ED7A385
MTELRLEELTKAYGRLHAIDSVSLSVERGEFLTLLGPSGCGKSTTLFAIAGLDRPTSGRILVRDQIFFDGASGRFVPPERRNCGLVFQSYALWPHLSVAGNLAFPLKIRKVARAEQTRRIAQALRLVEMEPFADRYPHELSGGQQQRVALARTLVFEPSLLLLDEPLSNLDAKLRTRARVWLKELHTRLGLSTIYVTHDQTEALAMSDRIAVMNGGRIVQLDAPNEIYRRPANAFVADFLGFGNLLRVTRRAARSDLIEVALPTGDVLLACDSPHVRPGEEVVAAVRPDHVRVEGESQAPGADTTNRLAGFVTGCTYIGGKYQYQIAVGPDCILGEDEREYEIGAKVCAAFKAADTVLVAAGGIGNGY